MAKIDTQLNQIFDILVSIQNGLIYFASLLTPHLAAFTVIVPENAAWSESIDQKFNPSNITVPVGTEVTWINEDGSEHTVTSGNVTNQVMMEDSIQIYLGRKMCSLTHLMNLEYIHIFVVLIHG